MEAESNSWKEMLLAIPFRNEAADVEPENNGIRVTVFAKENPVPLLLRWLIKTSDRKYYSIDELGKYVWEQCNGNNSVETIVDDFANKYCLSFHEARVSVCEYLKVMIQKGVIAIGMDKN
ncbi:MAG: PqqD family protein [Lentisphaeria bacterium]|nr:PqqD family protein [Lentisphaeria bacterium]